MYLNNLAAPAGARKKRKVVGRGTGSGHGKTCCRGHKGQGSRSGGGVSRGFEGGQMPLYRRLPKRGFSNARFKTEYEIVNLGRLNCFKDGATVTPKTLRKQGLIRGRRAGVKILSDGELKVKLHVQAHRFSKKAAEKIQQAHGTFSEIK